CPRSDDDSDYPLRPVFAMSFKRTVDSGLLLSLFAGARRQNINITDILDSLDLTTLKGVLEGSLQSSDVRVDLEVLGPLLRHLWHEMGDEASGFLRRPL